jgi:hypothetical protein
MKDYNWIVVEFSRDGKFIVANRINAARTESEVWMIETASGKQIRLPALQKFNRASDISSDGRYVAMRTEAASGIRQAALLDLRVKSIHILKPICGPRGRDVFLQTGARLCSKAMSMGGLPSASTMLARGNRKCCHRLTVTVELSASGRRLKIEGIGQEKHQIKF